MSTCEAERATLIAVDWGTTNRRGYLLNANCDILGVREDNMGILNVKDHAFHNALQQLTSSWRLADDNALPVVMSGMIGSRQGWFEAPYAHCPASPTDLATNVMAVPDAENVWIVPGICLDPGGARRDVMRGEEVQVFGALDITAQSSALLCLPGTHSKWVRVIDGKLVDFVTAMTGEVFRLMREHSILGTLMNDDATHDESAFDRGLKASSLSGGLLSHLFSVRADGLFGVTDNDQQASYLSGLLIGHEIQSLADTFPTCDATVLLVGSSGLAQIYGRALSQLDISFKAIDGQTATIRGLSAVWNASAKNTTRGTRG